MENSNFWNKKLIVLSFAAAAAVINPVFVFGTLSSAVSVLKPVFIGMTAAFVLNRPVCGIYDIIFALKEKNKPAAKYSGKSRRRVWLFSLAVVYTMLLAAAAVTVWVMIPQLAGSLEALAGNADAYREKFMLYYSALEKKDVLGLLPALSAAAGKLKDEMPGIIAGVYGRTAYFLSCTADAVIGAVISVYILAEKERLRVIVRKTAGKLVSPATYGKWAELYKTVYDIFSRFVSGQITEAAVLGVLCYIGMKLFRFPYALLISSIIGITALIPVVGAIAGTVPGALLLFLTEPVTAIWFIVYIIVLQQLENNLIYPRIVGKSMGLPPLPVLLAIIVGAKLGGGAGILLAVPLTAVLWGIFKEKILEEL